MVFVSSIFAFFTCINMAAYSVSKRGLEAFADCLRVEMASFGVKVSVVQPGNFGRSTSILKEKSTAAVWEKLGAERRALFSRRYVDLANRYYAASCRAGSKDGAVVVDAMLHAVTAARPRYRYLLASAADTFFFTLLQFLPTALTDAVMTCSSMYATRAATLYAAQAAQ
ncbi:D-beta-hydroxybutyrate dehydrogenase, mitochondrial [Liparis tanakae]|uniref:D-beta-hydroxybutyrate dehydrogenase, mitochondrial n=1 Tax=Liparis tanakae TaxID=230148 RepID=A0A4Z2DZC2_9TELE|nr:D-beta-hydroxybutyrate dehydrogenase, mitochondrial [Liparis tanakae]